MRKSVICCFVLLIATKSFAAWPLRDTVEFNQRQGLPNFFAKATKGDSVKVGFLGGSITEAVGWRDNIMNWLKARYKNNKIVQVNAAIGGTNSTYGVFRIEKDLLAKSNYDLIFIEFAVNDSGTDPEVEKSIEGLFRKIWGKNPKTDICMIYTVAATYLTDVANGKMNMTASKHDSIASYYKIPSVFMGLETYHAIQSDTVSWYTPITDAKNEKNAKGQYVFTGDNTHPTVFGHNFYTKIISRSLAKMENVKGTFIHTIPASIVANNYEQAHMVAISKTQNNGMTWVDKKGIYDFMDTYVSAAVHDNYVCSENPNASYGFTFTGNKVGLALIIGPSVGKYVMEIDKVAYPQTAFDYYCSYYRQQFKTIDLPLGTHTFKVYPSTDTMTIAQKTTVRTATDIAANPAKYCYNNLIFSHIMIVGTIDASTVVNSVSDKLSDFVCYSKDGHIMLEAKNQLNATSTICIFDANGRMVCRERIYNQQFKSAKLPKGIYSIQISGDSQYKTFKTIIN